MYKSIELPKQVLEPWGSASPARPPFEAKPLVMCCEGLDQCVLNRDRLLKTAIDATLELAYDYSPVRRGTLGMPGREVWQEMRDWLRKAQ